jgi:hypothetical protein
MTTTVPLPSDVAADEHAGTGQHTGTGEQTGAGASGGGLTSATPAAQAPVAPAATPNPNRKKWALELARACDRDGDGALDLAEMKEFATRTGGAEYTLAGWQLEYAAMAAEFGFQEDIGMPVRQAANLLHDTSPAGAYMSDEQLVKALHRVRQDRISEMRLRYMTPCEANRALKTVVINSVAVLEWRHAVAEPPLPQLR